jgi:hypothetical protein
MQYIPWQQATGIGESGVQMASGDAGGKMAPGNANVANGVQMASGDARGRMAPGNVTSGVQMASGGVISGDVMSGGVMSGLQMACEETARGVGGPSGVSDPETLPDVGMGTRLERHSVPG